MRQGTVMFQRTGSLSLRDGGNGGVEPGSDKAQEIIARIAGVPREKLGAMTIVAGNGKCVDCGGPTKRKSKRCQPCALKRSRTAMGSHIEGKPNATDQ